MIKPKEFLTEVYDKAALKENRIIDPEAIPDYYNTRTTIDVSEVESFDEYKAGITVDMKSGNYHHLPTTSYDEFKRITCQ